MRAHYFKLFCCWSACVWVSCTRAYVDTKLPPIERFSEYKGLVQPKVYTEPWWQALASPQINRLVEGLFDQNLQLKQASERVTQMRSLALQAGSQRWPSLSLDLGWSRTKQLNPFSRLSSSNRPMVPGGTTSVMPDSFTQDNFRASLAVSYELDMWGRIGSLTRAAELDALASENDLKTMAISLSASAVEICLQLIEINGRIKVTEDQLQDDQDQLQAVLIRFQQGLSPHIEVLQQTQQRDRTRAQLPPLKAQFSILKRQLAALHGVAILTDFEIPTGFPKLPAFPAVGLPVNILMQRPDIRAAQARLKSADARVSAAVSARLPGLRFGTNGGYQSFEFNELFDDFIWSVTSSLTAPLFQGGRLKAEQKRTEAVLRERLYTLKDRYISAFHEVENALVNEKSTVEQWQRLKEQMTSAEALFESAQSRYFQGVGDFLTTLTARQGLYAAQLAVLSSQKATVSARVQLHRALGGNWVEDFIRESEK